jgi:hypothetical protein
MLRFGIEGTCLWKVSTKFGGEIFRGLPPGEAGISGFFVVSRAFDPPAKGKRLKTRPNRRCPVDNLETLWGVVARHFAGASTVSELGTPGFAENLVFVASVFPAKLRFRLDGLLCPCGSEIFGTYPQRCLFWVIRMADTSLWKQKLAVASVSCRTRLAALIVGLRVFLRDYHTSTRNAPSPSALQRTVTANEQSDLAYATKVAWSPRTWVYMVTWGGTKG